jgi:hypothetical protein
VELVSSVADERNQLPLDEVMNIFGFVVLQKRRIGLGFLANLLKTANDIGSLFRRQDARMRERSGVRAAGVELEWQQDLVERKRPLPQFKRGIEWLPESARPHLHFVTS